MALLPPGTGGSGVGGTVAHNDLPGRDQPNAHPITAITGLSDTLAAHDTALATAQSLRQIYLFNNASSQVINLPPPYSTLSLALVLIRTSDGAMIEPEITYGYGPPPMRYIEQITLGFTPGITGEHVAHIIR